ncbi:MAG: alpha/beta hydrolase [Acidimicrobiia bacterium]|nr:alpha/beta hydrolase [Acidimicrobiia bacterium]
MRPFVRSAEPDGPAHPVPIVLVHGAWHGAWCWEERAVPGLVAAGFRVHAVDLRGHGRSSNPRSLRRTRIDHYVEDLESVVASIAEPVVVVGHSMGGLVVQHYVARHDDVAGAVLLCSVPVGGVLGATLRIARRHPIAFLMANLRLRLWPIVADADRAAGLFLRDGTDPAAAEAFGARLQDESYLAYLDMLLFRRPRPADVGVPVLVVGATGDRIFSVEEQERTAAAYGAEGVLVAGAPHDIMLDPAWEHAQAAIVDWIDDL